MFSDSTEERRDDLRRTSEVRVAIDSPQGMMFSRTLDVSPHGVFLAGAGTLENTDELRLRIELPEVGPVVATGKICHRMRPQEAIARSLTPGVGVRLNPTSAQSRRRWEAYFNR